LEERSTQMVRWIYARTGGSLPVVAVGGVMGAEGARTKLDAGASLVQIYTGLVYAGPGLVGRINRGLTANRA
jgi:dihydroorotate dehydrogenase